MTEIIRETVTTQTGTAAQTNTTAPVSKTAPLETRDATSTQQVEYLIYFLFGFLEILLGFRMVLKLAGASLSSSFVSALYGLTGIFVMPFEGIFRKGYTQGIETTAVLEPATLVALAVYAMMAWGIVSLLRISSGKEQAA